MIRSVYEGIVFAHKQHIDKLIASKGRSPVAIRLSGGATNSAAWMQIFADILNLPVETLACSELGGLGGAIIASQAINRLDLKTAVEKMVKVKSYIVPNGKEHQVYEQKYALYQSLLEVMEPIWEKLDQLGQE